jgi:hypothetical protein
VDGAEAGFSPDGPPGNPFPVPGLPARAFLESALRERPDFFEALEVEGTTLCRLGESAPPGLFSSGYTRCVPAIRP